MVLMKDTDSRQVLVVYNQNPDDYCAVLVAYEKKNDDWVPAFSGVPVMIGRNGFAPLDQKTEGDGKTPMGVFPLGMAFGYSSAVATGLDYRQSTAQDYWVDDSASSQYNTWVSGLPAAKSFEKMLREDHLYQYGIVIEYNTRPVVAGKGSAIFLHLWRDPSAPTAGCVAMAEADMLKLLRWLDKDKKPQIVLGISRVTLSDRQSHIRAF